MTRDLRSQLSGVISPEEIKQIYNSYDIVGDIAIIRATEVSTKYCGDIAKAIMNFHHNVKTVLVQTSPIRQGFRTRELRHVAGESKTVTTHVESGCKFSVDVSNCYFSPRLSCERMRVAKQVTAGETVVNMFAGVGCFSLLIAKYSNASRVFSIDINPVALEHMQKNIRVNRAYRRVIPLFGDAKDVIEARLLHVAERVLMPLPGKAFEYLSYALLALSEQRGWIHYYDFEHAKKTEDAVEKVRMKVVKKLADLNVAFEIPFGHVVRSTGPNWSQVVLDIFVKGSAWQV
ncbi:MAG TPA: class I SAM-dependent methyltransferase family protein [Candidatus Acidoferrum sp.]|nr:class I SAM-dependent methyltransferase family protein [Candidatus Acidoferrum sp.]